jgi:hypothetical protein
MVVVQVADAGIMLPLVNAILEMTKPPPPSPPPEEASAPEDPLDDELPELLLLEELPELDPLEEDEALDPWEPLLLVELPDPLLLLEPAPLDPEPEEDVLPPPFPVVLELQRASKSAKGIATKTDGQRVMTPMSSASSRRIRRVPGNHVGATSDIGPRALVPNISFADISKRRNRPVGRPVDVAGTRRRGLGAIGCRA